MRLLAGFESDLTELTVGCLSELYDGNPPFRGHGAMSYAPTVGEVLRAKKLMEDFIATLSDKQVDEYGIGVLVDGK